MKATPTSPAPLHVVGMAANDWQGQWVNRQQLLSRLGRRHPIVYSTGTWTVWDRHTDAWRSAPVGGAALRTDNVVVERSPRLLMRTPSFAPIDGLVVRAHARRLRRLAGFEQGRSVFLAFYPGFVPYARHIAADRLVYHAYDLFEATPGWTAADEALEIELLRRADLVTAVSDSIAERLQSKVSREVRLLPNGVDAAAFDPQASHNLAPPADLARIPRPWLGYVGSLHVQVDFALIAELARARPDWSFVLVGGRPKHKDDRAERDFESCRACPNVHLLGERSHREVSAYVTHMDVNLMLYRVSDKTWIKAIYPLKLHEYLASGRPVVSADIPAVRPFGEVVRIASGRAEWESAIAEALATGGTGTPESRRRVAADNTWDARVAQLEGWLDGLFADDRAAARSSKAAAAR